MINTERKVGVHMRHRIFAFLLVLGLMASFVPALPASASSTFDIQNGVLKDYSGSDENVIIPASVTQIGGDAFAYCKTMKSITFQSSITSIGGSAFFDCENLQNINIPDTVTTIGSEAFEGCNSLTTLTIPDSVTFIDDMTFRYCDNLESIQLSKNITNIPAGSFAQDIALKSIVIPDSVTSIAETAFYKCTALASVSGMNNVTSVGDRAFFGCPASITFYSNSLSVKSYVKNNLGSSTYFYSSISAVSLLSKPAKLFYKKNAALNLSGAKLRVKCSDGTTVTVPLASYMVSGYTANKNGRQTLTVKYNEKSASFPITVDTIAPTITVKQAKGYTTLKYSDANYAAKSLTLNGKKASWPGNGKLTKKGTYKATVTDKAGNSKAVKFKI
jgi:hypothetical protein